MNHRPQISFDAWMPVARDEQISYHYIDPSSGKLIRCDRGRWHRAKPRIAASVISSGQEAITVTGGRREFCWQRIVTCSQEQADQFLQEASRDDSAFLKGIYAKARAARTRRQNREASPV